MMTDLAPHHTHPQPDGYAFETPSGERTHDFEKAQRHSRHVRLLRIVLPVVTVAITGLYVVSVLRTAGVGIGLPTPDIRHILPSDLAMQNPHYEGYSEDGSRYKVRADTATPDLKDTNKIKLNGITADLFDAQMKKTTLKATRGLFNNKESLLLLNDGITIDGENGLKAQLTRASVFTKTKEIRSEDPVQVQFPAGSVRSDTMVFYQKQKHVLFSKNVVANLQPPPKKTDQAQTPSKANQMFVGSDKPVAITSATLDIFDIDKRAIFKGNVTAAQGLATLTAPELEASYDGGAAGNNKTKTATNDSAEAASSQPFGSNGKLRRIVAKGPVVMTQGPRDRVTCNAADFDAVNETAVLTGNVVLSSGVGRRATSDRVDLDQARERAVLTGNVIVTQDQNTLKGRRLDVDQRNGTTRLTSPAGIGYGAGRISARFVQNRPQKTSAPPTKGNMGAFRADPNAPLDITASQLLVEDKKKTAVFSGDVKARQGAFKIASAELHAVYSGSAALGDVTSRDGNGGGGATTLTHVKAKKNVVITGTDGQQVRGDWANFDMAANRAVVGGAVEIRQRGNIIHSTRLTIDTNTGKTIVEQAPKNTAAAPAGSGWSTTNGGRSGQSDAQAKRGRPSAIFYFNDINKARRSRSKGSKPSTGSAWEAQTAPR